MARLLQSKWIGGLVTLAGLAAIFALVVVNGAFGYLSVCDICGKQMNGERWFLPGTKRVIYESSLITDTPVSLALAKSPHEHHWKFCAGRSNYQCSLGNAHPILTTVYCEPVAGLLNESRRWGEKSLSEQLGKLALREESTRLVEHFAITMMQGGEFISAQEFRAWLEERDTVVAEIDAEAKKLK